MASTPCRKTTALSTCSGQALHKVDPTLKLGGPVFEGVNEDIRVWPDAQGRTSWMGRFLAYLKAHGRLSELSFASFEHYNFESCDINWKSLYAEPQVMKHILKVWRDDGGSEQYNWINDGQNSHPYPDNPPVANTVVENGQTAFILPKASITVLRGKRGRE